MKLCQACNRCFPDLARGCVEPAHPPLVEGPPVGTSIGETWVLERMLFSDPEGGGFVARSRKSGLTANILVRRPPAPEEEAAFALFLHESTLLAGLQELSIAGVEEFGRLPDGGAYAVLEPVGEETLREFLDREGRLSVPLAATIGRQVAEAAAALEQSGIVPGELSSERVGLRRRDSGPTVRLARFPGSLLPGSEGAEIPSFGGLLYQMLSGRPESGHAGAGPPPPPIQRTRPDLPESLGWLVMQCLHPSVAARPRSLAEIVRRITPFEQVAAEARDDSPAPAEVPPPVGAEGAPSEPLPQSAGAAPVPPPALEAPGPPIAPEISAAVPPPFLLGPHPVLPVPSVDPAPPPPAAPASQLVSGSNPDPIPAAQLEEEPGQRPPAPVNAAITAEIPILRTLHSYRNTPAPAKTQDPVTGPRPMFLDIPPVAAAPRIVPPPPVPPPAGAPPAVAPLSPTAELPSAPALTPPPVVRTASAGSWRRPPVSREPAFGSRGGAPAAGPGAAIANDMAAGSARMRQNFPPLSPPSVAVPSRRGRQAPEPFRATATGTSGRQIPISAGQSEVPFSSAPPPPSRFPTPTPTPPPVDAPRETVPAQPLDSPDSGIGAVTVGEDRTVEFETVRKGPRPGLIGGAALAILVGAIALFWLVIEATPPRRGTVPAARLGRKEVEPASAPASAVASTSISAVSTQAPRAPGNVSVDRGTGPASAPGSVAPAPGAAPPFSFPISRARAGGSSPVPPVPNREPDRPPRVASRERVGLPSADHAAAPREPAADKARPGAGLRDTLDAWIDSTNARDLSGHMRFYLPQVSTFYLSRNVSREYVRREKARLFQGGPVSVAAGEPEIDPSPDGRTATVRFRKRYAVSGARGEKRGEVIQEMKWIRTPGGWRIASERDAKILASR